jgi:GNAT superfamily N-acetyltransferase
VDFRLTRPGVIGQAAPMGEAIRADAHDDPAAVLALAGTFLDAEPVRHNLIATLLHRGVGTGAEGRFWTAHEGERVVGVTFQSPLHFFATVTPMPRDAVVATVERALADGISLPGVNGEAAVSAVFAGHWAECTRHPVRPVEGQRLYEVDEVTVPTARGAVRPATEADHGLAAEWLAAFAAELGDLPTDTDATTRRRIAARELWLHDDGGPVALAGLSTPVGGAVRVGPVYTPPARRGRGYASALVADRSATVRAAGLRCLLYADLTNPTSNGIYRAMGYRAVAETVRYAFDAPRG